MEDQNDTSDEPADAGRGGPVEASTASVEVPRADGDGEEIIRQQPVGRGQELGGGGFPSPDEPPRGPEELEER